MNDFDVSHQSLLLHSTWLLWAVGAGFAVGWPLVYLYKKRECMAAVMRMWLSLVCYWFLVELVIPKMLWNYIGPISTLFINPNNPLQDTAWKGVVTSICSCFMIALVFTAVGAGLFSVTRGFQAWRRQE